MVCIKKEIMPFTGNWSTLDNGRVYNNLAKISFTTEDPISDRLRMIASIILAPIFIVSASLFLGQLDVFGCFINLFGKNNETLKIKLLHFCKAIIKANLLTPLIGIAEVIVCLFGIFFSNNAKKLSYHLNLCFPNLHLRYVSQDFDPRLDEYPGSPYSPSSSNTSNDLGGTGNIEDID